MTNDTRSALGAGDPTISGAPSRRGVLQLFGVGAVALGTAGALAACGSDKPSASTGATTGASGLKTPQAFRVATAPGDNYFIDAVNMAEKQYDKYKLQVPKFIFPQSGVQAMQLLAAGAVEGFMADMLLTMATFANSQPGKRPQVVGIRVPETTYAVVVKGNSWPQGASFNDRMKALKGKRVGVPGVGAGADLQLRLALEEAGMAYGDVTHLGVGPLAGGIAQLKAGRIDAYVGTSFGISQSVAGATGGSVFIDFAKDGTPDILRKQVVGAIVTREDYVQAHEDVVKAWLSAQVEGKDWIVANPDKAADALNTGSFAGKAAGVSKACISHFVSDVVPNIKPMFKAPQETVSVMIEVAERLGMVKAGSVKYEDLVPAFARA